MLSPEHRETMAREAHDEYRFERLRRVAPAEPVLLDWPHLPEHLKDSNRSQIDHLEANLAAVGLGLRVAPGREPVIFAIPPDKAERMAELEHARWNVERLQAGWRPGRKDHVRKTSPYLVSWAMLSNDIRDYDRVAVKDLPQRLAKLGYEVYELAEGSG